MAQAATANTDELLSQLASSEIDRLLAEADGNPAPVGDRRSTDAPAPTGSERTALLEAAGFESPTSPAPAGDAPAAAPVEIEDERAALLQAAGFESPGDIENLHNSDAAAEAKSVDPNHVPFYLKPLVWINLPLEHCPEIIRPMMGKVGLVTLFNALAVLSYVIFFRKH
jgi:hypothetical protein